MSTAIPQGPGLTGVGMARQMNLTQGTAITTVVQPVINNPPQVTTVNMLQSAHNAQNAPQQPFTQATHMPGSHLPGQASIITPGVTHVGPLSNSQLTYAAVQQANNDAVNMEQSIIPSIQALRTTAVKQDLVQQRLQELNQLALPHQQGNHPHYNLPQSGPTQGPNKPKGKKEKVEVVLPQDVPSQSQGKL